MSGPATWLGLVRRPGDISRTSLYIAVLVLISYDVVIIATKGRLGRAKEAVATQAGVSELDT
jgi:hypothetical protein